MGKPPKSEWGLRAKAAGLDRATLAKLAASSPPSISRGLMGAWASGLPGHLLALILAWEIMSEEQRERWLAAVDAEGTGKKS